jgi:hypothetical protein
MLELIVLIVSLIVILIVVKYKNKTYEGFENTYYLDACPNGFSTYYDTNGDIMCCNGEIVANKCIGDTKCSLTGNSGEVKCIDLVLEINKERGKLVCPKSMPMYYENKMKKGCTNGMLNNSMTMPRTNTQPSCIIFNDDEKNTNSLKSCHNQMLLDDIACFGNNCKKELNQPIPDGPVMVGVSFTDNSGMHRTAYTKKSMEQFLNLVNPNWRNQGIDLSKNISVAEVAKAFYIDKTIDQSQIQF